jgi:glycosyltransferase involved in cell wall biosynthesis
MNEPFVNVTIPVYNEEKELTASVRQVVKFLKTRLCYPCEIVIANNGSTDATQAIAEGLSRRYAEVRLVSLPQSGRGRAIKKVWSESHADILSYMDVDLSTDLNSFPPLIEALLSGGCAVATGSRRLSDSCANRGLGREFLSSCYHVMLKALFHTQISDAQCGFKAITKKAATELLPLVVDNGWLMDTELLVLAERLGYRIFDLPVRWVEDTDSRVKVGRDAVAAIKGLFRLRRNLARGKYGHIQPAKSEGLCTASRISPRRARGLQVPVGHIS